MYTVFVNGNEIRFLDENRALRVAKQNNTVVFGLNRNLTHNGFLDDLNYGVFRFWMI
jgi:hypothetical protein